MVTVRKAVWSQVVARVSELAKDKVKVGVLASGLHEGSKASIAEIAAFHEFGTSTIPERSFLRSTFYQHGNELRALQAKLARMVVEGRLTTERALGILGTWAAAKVRNQISEHDIPPPLAEATIAAKGSSKPLVDTGQLMNSISWALGLSSEGVEP